MAFVRHCASKSPDCAEQRDNLALGILRLLHILCGPHVGRESKPLPMWKNVELKIPLTPLFIGVLAVGVVAAQSDASSTLRLNVVKKMGRLQHV